jgi:hypothetical protein
MNITDISAELLPSAGFIFYATGWTSQGDTRFETFTVAKVIKSLSLDPDDKDGDGPWNIDNF